MDSPVTIFSFVGSSATGFALYQLVPLLSQLKKKYIQYQQINEFTPTSLLNYFNQTQQTTVEAFIAGELISDSPIISKVPLIISEKKIYYVYENGIKSQSKSSNMVHLNQVLLTITIELKYGKTQLLITNFP